MSFHHDLSQGSFNYQFFGVVSNNANLWLFFRDWPLKMHENSGTPNWMVYNGKPY